MDIQIKNAIMKNFLSNSRSSGENSRFSSTDLNENSIDVVYSNLINIGSNENDITLKPEDESLKEKIEKEADADVVPDVASSPKLSSVNIVQLATPRLKKPPLKRQRKSMLDSPQSKMSCKKPELPGNSTMKTPTPVPALNLIGAESKKNVLVSTTMPLPDEDVWELKDKINSLEKDNGELLAYKINVQKILQSALEENAKNERAVKKAKLNRNKLKLGHFENVRSGLQFEQKWTGGMKFEDLERRKLLNEEKRKKKSQKPKMNSELSAMEYQVSLDIYDNIKIDINREDKELQIEMDNLTKERNSHIREIKRIENEESSRFNDFRILNNQYLLLSLLGKGGFSEVYKGFDMQNLCFVACKIHELNQSWPNDKKDSYIKHALREIIIHKGLKHNRIVRVLDVFNIDDDTFCSVLEYCEGNDLDFYLKQNKCMSESKARSVIGQVISGLVYLNDRQNPIIHYDLKPANILLFSDGEIKITDFGLSKICSNVDANADGLELTSQGAGTYWYLPPECFDTRNGTPLISNKVDVWSVGVIFFQCLYGIKPFGNNMTQTAILHNNTILKAKNIDFPTTPKVSDQAKEFIRKCCCYNKDQRPDVFQIFNDDIFKPKTQTK